MNRPLNARTTNTKRVTPFFRHENMLEALFPPHHIYIRSRTWLDPVHRVGHVGLQCTIRLNFAAIHAPPTVCPPQQAFVRLLITTLIHEMTLTDTSCLKQSLNNKYTSTSRRYRDLPQRTPAPTQATTVKRQCCGDAILGLHQSPRSPMRYNNTRVAIYTLPPPVLSYPVLSCPVVFYGRVTTFLDRSLTFSAARANRRNKQQANLTSHGST